MDTEKQIRELHSVADELEHLFPPEDILWFRELINNNEIYIGLEILLVQAYEHDITIPEKSYKILEKAGKGYIENRYFDRIT